MKVVCILAAVISAVLAVDNVAVQGHSGHSVRGAIGLAGGANQHVNRHAHSGNEQLSQKAGHQNDYSKGGYGQNQRVVKADNGFAHQDDDQSSALYDTLANQAANEAVRNANSVFKDGQFKQADVANKAGFNQANAQKKSFNRGKVLNDNISYGFDKKFNKHVGEKGGFEEELGSNSHKLDEFRERQRALNLRRGNHASALDRANAQKALREGKFNKNAAQKALHNSKYANKDNRLDRAQKRADLQDVAYDKKDKRFRANQKGKDESIRKFDDFNVKDAQFNRNDASAAQGKKGENAERFYRDGKHGRHGAGIAGHDGHDGHGTHDAHGGRDGANFGQVGGNAAKKSAIYGENTKHLQNANNHNARKAGKHAAALNDYQRAKDLYDVDQIKSLRDSRRGNLKNAVHNSANGGFNDQNAAAAKSASATNRQFADAAARKHASQAKKDLDEAKFDKENSKRILSDRHQNQRKLKRFFHDKQEGGNNFERLKFNRKRIESDFGNQQAAAAQSAKKFNVAHNQNAFTADRRKDENVHARQAKGQKHKRNKAASINGHHKKNTGKAAQSASVAQGYKQNSGQKSYHNNNIAQVQGRQGVQETAGRGGLQGNQHVGGTHGNGGFSNFGNNFHSFGNNGFGITPIKRGRVGYQSNDIGFNSGFGFQGKPQSNFGRNGFAPFRFSFSSFRK